MDLPVPNSFYRVIKQDVKNDLFGHEEKPKPRIKQKKVINKRVIIRSSPKKEGRHAEFIREMHQIQ